MTAEALGARLLGEVKEESLDELLQSLRRLANASPTSNVALFEDLLCSQYSTLPPRVDSHECPAGELSRPLPDLSGSKVPIINLTSIQPASGRSQLLYYVLATSILPLHCQTNSRRRINLPGRKSLVIILDTDGRFSALRLRQVLHDILARHARRHPPEDSLTNGDVEDTISQYLTLVHIFRPRSTSQVLEILKALPAYLLSQPSPSSRYTLGVLALDSVSSFFWPDRLSQDLARLPPAPDQEHSEQHRNFTPEILATVKSLQSTFACPMVYTSTLGLNPFPAGFSTLTLRLEKVPVPRFPPLMTLQEAGGREKETRSIEVAKGRFSATVMGDNTGTGIGHAWIGFRVLEDGVVIEADDNPEVE